MSKYEVLYMLVDAVHYRISQRTANNNMYAECKITEHVFIKCIN